MHLDHVEGVERAFDRRGAAAERQVGLVEAHLRAGIGDDPAPVAARQAADWVPEGVELVGLIAVGVETAARPEAVVAERRDDHPLPRGTLRDQLRRAPLELDPGALHLYDHAGVDGQPAAVSGHHDAGVVGIEIPAGPAGDHQVLLQHVDHVGAPQPGRHVQMLQRPAESRVDLDEQSVDRVVGEPVAAELGADPAGGVLEAVGRGRECRTGAPRDGAEGDRGPRALELDRRQGDELRVHQHLPAAVGERRLADGVDKRLLRGGVGILAKHDAAPLAAARRRPDAVGIAADRVVVVRREDHVVARGAQHLQRGAGPRRARQGRRAADVDHRGPQLEDGPGVDHGRDALRHRERRAVRQRPPREVGADQVRATGVVAEDPDERPGSDGVDRRLDGRIRRRERAAAAGCSRLVNEHGVGERRGAEPERVHPAGRAIPVAVEGGSRDVHHRGARGGGGGEAEPGLVEAFGAAPDARIRQLGIERRVAHARDGEEVGAAFERQPDEGIPPVVVVVAGDQRSHRLAVDDVVAVQREHAVQFAGNLLTRPGDHGLGGEGSRLRKLESIEIDVGSARGIELPEMDDVVVAREHGLPGQRASHDRGQVIGMVEPQRVADLMDADVEPIAAVLALAPVDGRVQHHVVATPEAGDAGDGGVRVESPQVARGDGDAALGRLHEPHAGDEAVKLEDFPGPLLLRLGDHVLEGIGLRIEAVVGAEVVFDHRDPSGGIDAGERQAVGAAVDRGVAMPRFVHRAGLAREADVADGRLHLRPRVDRSLQRRQRGGGGAAGGLPEGAEILGGGERGVLVGALRLRSERRDGLAADLQAEHRAIGEVGREPQSGPAGGGVERHGGGNEGGADVVAGGIDGDQPVERGGLGGRLQQGFVRVEVDVDRIAGLRQRSADSRDRLRNDGPHKGAELETEVDRRSVHTAAIGGPEAGSDDDLVAVVRERVLEPDHDLVLVRGVVHQNAAEVDGRIGEGAAGPEGVAPASAPPYRDGAERGGAAVDHDAGAEPQGDLLRRLDERRRGDCITRDVERGEALGVGRHEIERHHAAVFELLELLDRPQPLGAGCIAPPLCRRPAAGVGERTAGDAQTAERKQTHGCPDPFGDPCGNQRATRADLELNAVATPRGNET